MEAILCTLPHEIHVEGTVCRHVVPGHKLVHIEGMAVAGDIKIISCIRGVGFDEVVRANQALRIT